MDAAQLPFVRAGMHYVVRSNEPSATLAPAFRRAVSTLDPRVAIWNVRTPGQIEAESTARAHEEK